MEGQTMVQIAIAERNDNIFNLICKKSEEDMDELNSRTDDKGNTILHYAADIAPSHQLNSVSGAALQMQREAQWFKAVKSILLERHRLVRNKAGITAQGIFTEKHKDLVMKGEKWMRGTSHSCMLVATLISIVAFAAAFTVPGGNYNDAKRDTVNGLPILLNNNSFIVFAVADALALFPSGTSVLMFLAILTSRYSEEHFVKALPQKFILGLATLFISMATMMIAFSSAIHIMLCPRWTWIIIPITLLGCVQVASFVWLLFPVFVEMAVESILLERHRLVRNKDGFTAQCIFTEKHKDLVMKGAKWMRGTSHSCMLVADASALFSSVTSVLMFLAILTSRYSEEDFVKALPQKFILGLGTLFISMATMMIAFSSAIHILLCPRWTWIIIPITLLGCVQVASFV
ncbi:hypothetical protein C5167_021504 [Papaver somniferum]|nr:hypothetical protein C5167_021504 [Papaver somniferum]